MLFRKVKSESGNLTGKDMKCNFAGNTTFHPFFKFLTIKRVFFYSFFARVTLIKQPPRVYYLSKTQAETWDRRTDAVPP